MPDGVTIEEEVAGLERKDYSVCLLGRGSMYGKMYSIILYSQFPSYIIQNQSSEVCPSQLPPVQPVTDLAHCSLLGAVCRHDWSMSQL
jgi:hypothetical protein